MTIAALEKDSRITNALEDWTVDYCKLYFTSNHTNKSKTHQNLQHYRILENAFIFQKKIFQQLGL